MHDLVIEDVELVDGTGSARQRTSLAVKDGHVAAIGRDPGPARQRVKGEGRVLAPGIIDLHTHYDAQLIWDPFATPSVGLGVTSVIIGNCGFTIAPCRPADRDRTLRNLTHVEGMSLEALQAGVAWEFESYADYLRMLERRGLVPNVASFVGHSSVRTFVLGEEASSRAATRQEVAQMKSIVVDALAAGAVGFSTSTLEQHNGENGVPMPSRLADEHELFELTDALREAGKGVFQITKGMRTSIPWLESVAARNGRPAMIAAMFVDPNDPQRVFREFDEIGAARRRGRELWGHVSCFPLGMEFTLRHPYPLEALLAWRPAIEAEDSLRYQRVLSDAGFRAAVKAEARAVTVPNRFSYHSLEHMTLQSIECPHHAALVGRNVAQLARDAGKDAFDWLFDFGLDGELDAMLDCKLFNTDEDAVRDLMRLPDAQLTLSDAGAHLSFLCDAGFGLHLFGHWVRERGDMTLERAVQSVTGQPASLYRIADRGRLLPGAWADMILFDPASVGRGQKRRVHDLPGGASRVDTPSVGLHGVWVNGVQVVDARGPIEGSGRPGKLMRQFAS